MFSPEGEHYLDILRLIEKYCTQQKLDHRFVGGTLTDFIGPQTQFKIDVHNRTVRLIDPMNSTAERPDGTTKDVDIVVFTPNRLEFGLSRREFQRWTTENEGLPKISIEAACHPSWPELNHWKQWVTAWEIDNQRRPHLNFGSVDKVLNPDSIAPWKVDLGSDTRITSFNPIAHMLCYALRVPSGVKKKDRESIGIYDFGNGEQPYSKMDLLKIFADQTIKAGLQEGINYCELFAEWRDYIETLSKRPDILTRVKGIITGLYWDTIGPKVAHGIGPLGSLSRLSDRLNG